MDKPDLSAGNGWFAQLIKHYPGMKGVNPNDLPAQQPVPELELPVAETRTLHEICLSVPENLRERFQRIVRMNLHLLREMKRIASSESNHKKKRERFVVCGQPGIAVPILLTPTGMLVRELRRIASQVEGTARRLEKHHAKLILRTHIPQAPPIAQLRMYAAELSLRANSAESALATQSRPTVRRKPRPISKEIVDFAVFVEGTAGQPYRERTAELIAFALQEPAFNAEQLRKLVKYHTKPKKLVVGRIRKPEK